MPLLPRLESATATSLVENDRPERYPEIDTSRVIVQQLHRPSDEQVRALARETTKRWGLSEG